jgi:nitrate/nitrite transport system substrate-binding protein
MTNRRTFLKAMGATTAGVLASTWAYRSQTAADSRFLDTLDIDPIVDPQTLEKPQLKIGFVPVNDCAPFAVAWQKGLFRKYGLEVTLSREASWANARDGLIFGRLDAAPVVVGAVTNARIGAEGARHAPLSAAMTIHRHGNAMTFDRGFWDAGIRPWSSYQGDLGRFGQDLGQYFSAIPSDQRVWGSVLSSAIYEYLIRYVVAAAGIAPDEAFRLMIQPPPQMVNGLRLGAMQAFMVGEPWNTRAIATHENVGFTFAQGREIWRAHPDRVLGVMESFIEENPKTYRSLVKAMIEACQYCSDPAHRAEVAQLVAEPAFTGLRPRPVEGAAQLAVDALTSPGIVGNYDYGGFDQQPRLVASEETTLFFDLPADLRQDAADHSTFLWQSQSLWLMTQAARWGQIAEIPKQAEALAKKAWRTDLYREIAAEMGIPCPSDDYQVEPAERFVDGKAFDPSDPVGYLNSFGIRANRPHAFALT